MIPLVRGRAIPRPESSRASSTVRARRPSPSARPGARSRGAACPRPVDERPHSVKGPAGVPQPRGTAVALAQLVQVPRPRPTAEGVPGARSPATSQHRPTTNRADATRRRRWLRSPVSGGAAAVTVGVMSLIGLLWLLPFGSEREETLDASPATELPTDVQPPSAQPDDASNVTAAADINLPPPFGDVPRDRPLQTVWLIAPEAMSLATDVIVQEGGLVIEYMATYGIIGDGLAIGTDPLRRVTVATDDLTSSLGSPDLADSAPAEVLAAVTTQLDTYLDDHTTVIALTTDPSPWQDALDDTFGPVPGPEVETEGAAATDRSSATRNAHVFELRPGSTNHDSIPADGLSRITVIDPEVPGALASELARTWVESYGGGFNPDL